MKTKKLSLKLVTGVIAMIAITTQSYAQDELFKAEIYEEDVPTVILEEITEDFGDYQLYDVAAIPVEFVEEDIIVETDNLGTRDYNSYELKLKKGNDLLTVFYNKEGDLIYSTEKGVDVALPVPVRNAVAKEYPGWTITSDVYKMKHRKGKEEKIRYKIFLKKNNNKIKVYTDENGTIL